MTRWRERSAGRGALLLLLAVVCTVAVTWIPDETTPAAPTDPPGGAGVDPSWWAEARENLRADEYRVSWQERTAVPGLEKAWHAPNRAHDLRTYFTKDGVRVVRRSEPVPTWEWGLSLVGYGRGESTSEVKPPDLRPSRNRIDYLRGPLVEWYVNDESGLKQGFTLDVPPDDHEPPDPEAPAHLTLKLDGSLSPVVSGDGRVIDFRAPGGARVLRYAELVVTDAGGRVLPSWMEGDVEAGARGIRILFDDRDAAYPVTVDPLATSPAWSVESDQASAFMGYDVATAGDVNGDGYSDVIVGAYGYDDGEFDEGRAFVYLGSAAGLAITPAWTDEGDQLSANFGISVDTAGDVNGDGYSDVVVGAFRYDDTASDEGRAFVYHGSPTGLSLTPDWMADGELATVWFGRDVAPAGDVDGDGFGDLLVGAPFHSSPAVRKGRAFLFRGSAAGLSLTPDWEASGADANLDEFGLSLGTAGDVNGDGYADIVVGAWSHSDGQTDEGRIFVYHGSPSGPSLTPDWVASSDQSQARLGWSVATAGDVNGDGYADLIAGAYLFGNGESEEGRAFVFHGSATGLPGGPSAGPADAAWTFESDQAGAQLGISVATAGDVNGDGYADVIVGANGHDNVEVDEGCAFIFFGSSTGLSTAPDWTAESDQDSAGLGIAVAPAGDVNGDGYADVIVGADKYDDLEVDEGRAFLYLGSPGGPGTFAGWSVSGATGGDRYGFSVAGAGDVNGDGHADVIVGALREDPVSDDEGRAYLYLGTDGGLSVTPAWDFAGSQVDELLGYSVAGAGDVNGDGYGDVIVGAPQFTDSSGGLTVFLQGRALVFHGSPSGLDPTPAITLDCEKQRLGYCGTSVAGAGDVNGDGYGDVVVGAPRADAGFADEAGRAYLYFGGPGGVSLVPASAVIGDLDNERLGWSVSSAGDVNGDGYSDVVIGKNLLSDPNQISLEVGRVYHGSLTGLDLQAPTPLRLGQREGASNISVSSAGDVNGDGYADVIVGAPYADNFTAGRVNSGKALIFLGSPTGVPATSDWTFESVEDSTFLGYSVSGAGDVNGDGFADVIVGKPYFNVPDPSPNGGEALIFLGSASGPGTTPDETLSNSQPGALFGIAVAGPGDVDGDGYGELLVGASAFDTTTGDEGIAGLYLGNQGGGTALLPAQRRVDGAAPVALLGMSDDGTGFRIGAAGRTPFGRTRVKLEWEVKPLGTLFDGAVTSISAAWMDTGIAGAALEEVVSGLQAGDRVHWRLRLLYDPSASPYGQASRWLTPPWTGAEETDLRTALDIALAVTQVDSPDPVLVYSQITYTLTVSNLGVEPAPAFVEDDLPDFTTLVSATPSQGSCAPAVERVICDLGILPAGGGASIAVLVQADNIGERTNTARVEGDGRDGDRSDNLSLETTTIRRVEIGDLVWHDLDGDGVRDPDEPGLSGVLVALYRADGVGLYTRFTSASGFYLFRDGSLSVNLNPGNDYYLRFFPPEGYVLTAPDQGGDDLLDSDADPFTLRTPTFTFGDGDDPVRWDAGMILSCLPPDEPVYIANMTLTSDGNGFPVLHYQDSNQLSQVTGYNIYRSSDPGLPVEQWPLLADDVVDMDEAEPNLQYVDTTGDVAPGGIWYYKVAAFNGRCPAETAEGPL